MIEIQGKQEFTSLNNVELINVSGGGDAGILTAAIGYVTFLGITAKKGFECGRQFVRDVRKKFF